MRKYIINTGFHAKRNIVIFINSDIVAKLTNEFNSKGFTSLQTIENKKLKFSILKKINIKEKSTKNFWHKDKYSREYSQNIFLDFSELEKLFKGELGKLLRNIYQCDFNIFRGKMIHSKRSSEHDASGSQLWHSDGNPGTCINVMFYIQKLQLDRTINFCLGRNQKIIK